MGASCNSQEGFPGRGLRRKNSRIPRATCLVVDRGELAVTPETPGFIGVLFCWMGTFPQRE